MNDRTELHRLLDQLPEEALEATFRVLENYMQWPPKGRADAEKLLAQSRERFLQRAAEHSGGIIASSSASGSYAPDGYGCGSTRGWEGHTAVHVSVHFFRGHELHTIERLSLSEDKEMLTYAVEAKVPDGNPQAHTFTFLLDR